MKQWYIIHVYSGYERRVKHFLEEAISNEGLGDEFGRIFIPTETISKVREGNRKVLERQLYPGYIVIEMEPTKEALRLVSQTPGVTTFFGSKLQSLKDSDVQRILALVERKGRTTPAEVPFKKGESIKITDGPFTDFVGSVEEIDLDREKVKVMVTIFGRATPVELSFVQVKPI
jgi:transcriptional antiterminator NusG